MKVLATHRAKRRHSLSYVRDKLVILMIRCSTALPPASQNVGPDRTIRQQTGCDGHAWAPVPGYKLRCPILKAPVPVSSYPQAAAPGVTRSRSCEGSALRRDLCALWKSGLRGNGEKERKRQRREARSPLPENTQRRCRGSRSEQRSACVPLAKKQKENATLRNPRPPAPPPPPKKKKNKKHSDSSGSELLPGA